MKFIVFRTSNIGGRLQPCEEAILRKEFAPNDKIWEVEFNSLQELIDFCDKYNGVVIERHYRYTEEFVIEIYDTWRE